jgi:hypothetical protein
MTAVAAAAATASSSCMNAYGRWGMSSAYLAQDISKACYEAGGAVYLAQYTSYMTRHAMLLVGPPYYLQQRAEGVWCGQG